MDETRESERMETIREQRDLLAVVQEMGKRLADETHGNSYDAVRELNELLHQATRHAETIANETR